jgi:hypothetical protein
MTAELAHKGDTCGSCGQRLKVGDPLYRVTVRQLKRCEACARPLLIGPLPCPVAGVRVSAPPLAIPKLGRSKRCPSCGESWNRVTCACGHTEADDYAAADRGMGKAPERFNRFQIGSQLKRNILAARDADWKQKASGG